MEVSQKNANMEISQNNSSHLYHRHHILWLKRVRNHGALLLLSISFNNVGPKKGCVMSTLLGCEKKQPN